MSNSLLSTPPGTSWRSGQPGQPDLRMGVCGLRKAAAVQPTQPAGLRCSGSLRAKEEVPADGRCPSVRYQFAGRVTQGSWPHRPGRIDAVAPYGAKNAAGVLGCSPPPLAGSALACFLLCNPSRSGTNPRAWTWG